MEENSVNQCFLYFVKDSNMCSELLVGGLFGYFGEFGDEIDFVVVTERSTKQSDFMVN